MKLKKTIIVASALVAGALTSSAATYSLFNVAGGPGVDTLWANADGTLMNGTGSVSMGYFATNPDTSAILTSEDLFALLSLNSFTVVQSAVAGTSTAFTAPGFLAEDPSSGGTITTGNALLGRKIYAIATDAATLASRTASSVYSMFEVATIVDDVPFEQSYVANPAGSTIILGNLGAYEDSGDAFGLGAGTYTTLGLAGVPEPSAALLGGIGALGLLRRRRN